ncbi:LOW QUALITY PROTEIN: UDP-glycosyltransferase 83A1-like [Phalaenopsis equestris]|uniref:LOW QUALITY PROTEIN: UDP-glycosyltransferase 83A1-like n=1 Tax=Phalaenopsis equestris TaxID=78828 RepID=UPI0009E5C9F1|nr:LOW QUALITY PROTEIN: UDP-glycosyltransferase 83A1-like [Phalaenopsis equestris]
MSSARTPHALILPYPAQGHIVPMMELSYRLIERGVRITFINTHFNHNRIFATKASGQATFIGEEIDGINFVAIPDGLEPEDDRHDFGGLTQSLMKVMPTLLEELIRDNGGEFTCFVADINMAWALKIGKNLGLRTAAFWPAAAAAGLLDAIFSIPELIQNGVIDEHGALMKKEVIQLNPGITPLDSANLPWHCFDDAYTKVIIFNYLITNNQATSNAEMMICNSFEELEKPIFSKIPHILPVGPLDSKFESRDLNLCQLWPEDKQCIAWLDKQSTNSVIYVAFGSITIFNNKQFQELALGLELTGRPFLWVVRPDLTNKTVNCTFPLGFEERVANRGRMVGWSPQHKVLKHPAIACFVSHCGWNSTIEGLRNGVPFLCFPYFCDQLFNQKYITDVWRIGLSLTRDENGLISKEEVRSKVEELLKDTNIITKSLSLKQLASSSVMEGGSSLKNLNKFAEFLRENQVKEVQKLV